MAHKSNVNLTFVQYGVRCYVYTFHVSECHESYQDVQGRIFFYEHTSKTDFLNLIYLFYFSTNIIAINLLYFGIIIAIYLLYFSIIIVKKHGVLIHLGGKETCTKMYCDVIIL